MFNKFNNRPFLLENSTTLVKLGLNFVFIQLINKFQLKLTHENFKIKKAQSLISQFSEFSFDFHSRKYLIHKNSARQTNIKNNIINI